MKNEFFTWQFVFCTKLSDFEKGMVIIMAYKILVLDIDGTLTNAEKEITALTKEAIFRVQRMGHIVVLASGRPTPGIIPIAKKLHLEEYGGYILSFNGAKVIECKTGKIIYQNTLPRDIIPELYEMAIKEKTGLISYNETSVIVGTELDRFIELEARINQMPIEQVDDFVGYINYDVNKCLMTAEDTHLAKVEIKMKEQFGRKINVYRSEGFFLELVPQNVDKAYSLGKLLEYLSLKRENMVCCGDGYNDITMIEYAGLGVAMENAQDKVKEVADYITSSNNEDGIAKVIEKFFVC